MKYTKLALGLGVAITMVSCGTTKTTSTTTISAAKMITITDTVVAKKGEMSDQEIHDWPHMDILKDSVPGMSLDKANNFVKNKKATTVKKP